MDIRPALAAAAIATGALAQPQSPREQAREAGDQGTPPRAAEEPSKRPITYSVRLGGEMGLNANLDTAGDATVSRARAGLTVGIPAGERGQMSLGYDYEISGYDFDGATAIIPGAADPWDVVHTHSLSATYFRRASRRWFWLVGGNVSWSAEEHADFGDAATYGGFGAAQFAVTEKLLVGLGVGARSRIEDSVVVYPVILLDWTVSERFKVSNEGRPGLTLSYVPDETLSFDLTGTYEFRDFRLDDGGPLPDGVGSDSRMPISLGVTWTPRPMFTFGARAGVYFFQEFEAMDSNGFTVGSDDADAAPFFALEGRIRF